MLAYVRTHVGHDSQPPSFAGTVSPLACISLSSLVALALGGAHDCIGGVLVQPIAS